MHCEISLSLLTRFNLVRTRIFQVLEVSIRGHLRSTGLGEEIEGEGILRLLDHSNGLGQEAFFVGLLVLEVLFRMILLHLHCHRNSLGAWGYITATVLPDFRVTWLADTKCSSKGLGIRAWGFSVYRNVVGEDCIKA